VTLEFTAALAALWAALLLLAVFLLRSSRRTQFWALWFLVFLAPVLQIVPFGIWVADRYLYVPIIGLLVLASGFFFDLPERITYSSERQARATARAWEAAMFVVLVALAWRTTVRLPVWKDDLTLWEATYPTCPNSAYCNENLGLALLRAGQVQRGGDLLVRAVELRPSPSYLVNLANALSLAARNYREAIRLYRLALESPLASSGNPLWVTDAYAGLARASILLGNLEDAAQAIEKGKGRSPGNPRLWIVEAFLHWKRGDLAEARRSLQVSLMITGQAPRYFAFFTQYWGDSADVANLLAALRADRAAPSATPQVPQPGPGQ